MSETNQVDDETVTTAKQAEVTIQVVTAPQVNFAFHQNSVALLRDVALSNHGKITLTDLTLEMSGSPAFIRPKTWHIDRLPANGSVYIDDRDTRLDAQFLLHLQESQQGELLFTLKASSGAILTEACHPVEVLARNEWGGYGNSPELLAAFSMPNDPAIERLLRATSDVLRAEGHDGTLLPYENAGPERIWLQVSAAWSAVLSLKLDYAHPPCSFEKTGQKVRTPSAILDSLRATCLDSTLLLTAMFEQMGLHPLIILEEGHAYVGVWLIDDGFAQSYTEDLLALRKRAQLNELIVMETTLLAQNAHFKAALKTASDQLHDNDHKFVGVLDISRARDERVRPLSFVEQIAGPATNAPDEIPGGTALVQPDADAFSHREIQWKAEESGPGGRLGNWQRRLLDLSLRNPLLNMRRGKTTIRLIAPNPGKLEDLLADGKKFAIESAPGIGQRDEKLHARRTGNNLDEEIATAALSRGIIYVDEEPQRLESALVDLYRKARNDLEEGGSNTLYLAVGMLYWQKPGITERTYLAPLILVPVTITRQSVRSGVRLSLSDDEPRFNTTLLEFLRQEFQLDIPGLEGELPSDGSGTDITAILTLVRQKIKDVAGFEVREEVYLGTFSFAKYLMWKDLVDRTDSLKQNPVVHHLIENPREPFKENADFIEPRELDSLVSPEALYTPLTADSSQLAAVVAGAAGKNFVMIGPPGTGKSQTIANMIAHNLGLGRTVLFVSEKAAALDVVYRRLREQGLGEFCLELHSNKARKLDVLRQLGEAWTAKGKLSEDQWQAEAKNLQETRDQLNAFVSALHRTGSNGLTVRTALAQAAGNPDTPEVRLSFASADAHTPAAYNDMLSIADRMDVNLDQVGNPADHPLSLINACEWSHQWQSQLVPQAQDLSEKAKAYHSAITWLQDRLQLQRTTLSRPVMEASSALVKTLRRCAGKNLEFAFGQDANATLETINQAKALIEEYHATEGKLSAPYDRDKMLSSDLTAPRRLWENAITSWFLPRILNTSKSRKLLVTLSGARQKPDPGTDLPLLERLQAINKQLIAMALTGVPGWNGLNSDVTRMTEAADLARELRRVMTSLAPDPESLVSLRNALKPMVGEASELLGEGAPLGEELKAFIATEDRFLQALDSFGSLAGQTRDSLLNLSSPLEQLAAFGDAITTHQPRINAWCAWRRVRAEAVQAGLTPLVEALETGAIAPGNIRHVLAVNYARWWVPLMIDSTPALRMFVSAEHEKRIQTFRDLDARVRQVTADYIRTRIRSDLADKEDVKKSSSFGIIRRELEKKTRHKPLRQLMQEAGDAITKLTPCLLMSPLSIAQYLPVDHEPFDVVIFDEASQITVWDAIGAIARGKQAIVVGDPKQLPPTSFFSSGQSAEDDSEAEEDLESILDEMLGSNLPTINLSWHYRSRHESLITFSNQRYYKSGLVTFPSPVTRDTAVSLTFVGGEYDRGGTQTNRKEADAIVAEITARLLNPETEKQTIGAVTFNQKQQALILDLLDEARRNNPALDRFFAEDLLEAVFVKNLEAVQGDERDVILFSTTFGPDRDGRMSMNFGPLNKSGGERRLNVAITRARVELKVFSSMRADQIDLGRTAALGVRDLKHFLEFAEKNGEHLEALNDSLNNFQSPLEQAVAADMARRGWIVHPQIGVSQFRVDLAVVDPAQPDRYLAGIECDGTTYQQAATARDRDLVREGVLTGLGWQILRFWSMDYWLNPTGVIDALDNKLREIADKSSAKG